MFYRFVQFYKAIHPKINPEEKTFVKKNLSPLQIKLFYRQSQVEQRHALDVANDLISQTISQLSISQTELTTLITAALLHDCGKSLFHIHIWQRIFIVLFFKMPFQMQKIICSKNNVFSRTIKLYKKHPHIGSHLAKKAGASSEITALIKYHHEPNSTLGLLLYNADNRN
jgi:HD-GYP domain-containing protein (c-di-GMP phosphodiesterase class II)